MQQSNIPPPAAIVTANGTSQRLYGTPRAYHSSQPGTATVILGTLADGTPLAIATDSLDWLEEGKEAFLQAWARGKVRGGMTRAVTQ